MYIWSETAYIVRTYVLTWRAERKKERKILVYLKQALNGAGDLGQASKMGSTVLLAVTPFIRRYTAYAKKKIQIILHLEKAQFFLLKGDGDPMFNKQANELRF